MNILSNLLKSRTGRDTFISLIGTGITTLGGLLYTIMLARFLGPDSFGIFSSVVALSTIFYNTGDLGMFPALVHFFPKMGDKKEKIINTSLFFQTLICALVLVVFVTISRVNSLFIPGSLSEQIILAGILASNYLILLFVQNLFTVERSFWKITISQSLDSLIKISLVFILFRTSGLSISTAILANILSTAIATAIIFGKRLMLLKPQIEKPILIKMSHYAKWLALSRIFSVTASKIDVILINLLVNSFAAGIFSSASRVTLFYQILISSLNSVVNPRFSSFDTREKIITFMKKLSLVILGMLLLMFMLVAISEPLISFVFGSEYLPAVPVFKALSLAMIPYFFTIIITPPILYSYGKSAFFSLVSVFQFASMIALEFLFIPIFGIYAPAYALGITNIIATIILVIKLKQLLQSDPDRVLLD